MASHAFAESRSNDNRDPNAHSETRVLAPAEAATFLVQPHATTIARSRSVEDLISEAPGVFMLRHATEGKGAQYFVRGFDAQHGTDLELTFEGVPLNLDSHIHGHGYIDLSWLPRDAVAQLRYQGGSYDLGQGPFATGGSLTLRLPDGKAPARYEVGIGFNNQVRGQLSARTQSHLRHFRHFSASEFTLANSWASSRSGYRFASLQRIQWGGEGNAAHSLIFAVGHTRFDVPTFVRRSDVESGTWRGTSYLDNLSGLTSSGRWQYRVNHRIRSGLIFEAQAAFAVHHFRYHENATGYLLDPLHGDGRVQEDRRESLYVRAELQQRLHRDHRLRWLAGSQITHARQSIHPRDIAGNNGAEASQETTFWLPHIFTGVEWQAHAGTWFQSQLSLRADLWHLSPYEATLDRHFSDSVAALSPRLKLRFRWNDAWALTLAGGVGQRPSEARSIIQTNDYTIIDDSSPLRSTAPTSQRSRFGDGQARLTTSQSLDLGVHWETQALRTQIALFGVWLSNESFYDHVAGLTYLLNASRRLGVEADLQWEPHSIVSLGGKLSAVHARSIESGAAVPGAPTLFSSLFFGVHHAELVRVELAGRLVGERVLRYDARAGAYFLLDASIVAQPESWLSLSFSIENLLNARVEDAMYNFPSRWDAQAASSQLPRLHALYGSPRSFWFELRVHL